MLNLSRLNLIRNQKMTLDYGEIQKRIAFEIMRMMAEFDIDQIDLHSGHHNFYMESSEFPKGIVLNKQKDKP
jgi:hypothetical protein